MIIKLLASWITGVLGLAGILVLIYGLGFLTRLLAPNRIDAGPASGEDVAANLIVGVVVAIALSVPLCLGVAILF